MADTPHQTPITFTCTCTPTHEFISECPAYLLSPEYLAHQDALLKATHEQEQYAIEEYSSVFEAMQAKYDEVKKKLSDLTDDEIQSDRGFRERILRAVLAHVHEMMGMNELALEEVRRELWGDYQHMEESMRFGDLEGSMTFGEGEAKCGECGMTMEQKGEGVRDTGDKMGEGKDEEIVLGRSLMKRKEEDCEWETLESHEQYFDGKYP